MIYIITPYVQDFRQACKDNKLPYYPIGRSSNEVIWIESYEKLLGRKIFKEDKIIYGEQYHQFSLEEMERIKVEIALRTER